MSKLTLEEACRLLLGDGCSEELTVHVPLSVERQLEAIGLVFGVDAVDVSMLNCLVNEVVGTYHYGRQTGARDHKHREEMMGWANDTKRAEEEYEKIHAQLKEMTRQRDKYKEVDFGPLANELLLGKLEEMTKDRDQYKKSYNLVLELYKAERDEYNKLAEKAEKTETKDQPRPFKVGDKVMIAGRVERLDAGDDAGLDILVSVDEGGDVWVDSSLGNIRVLDNPKDSE